MIDAPWSRVQLAAALNYLFFCSNPIKPFTTHQLGGVSWTDPNTTHLPIGGFGLELPPLVWGHSTCMMYHKLGLGICQLPCLVVIEKHRCYAAAFVCVGGLIGKGSYSPGCAAVIFGMWKRKRK